jgi:hypothetical protein
MKMKEAAKLRQPLFRPSLENQNKPQAQAAYTAAVVATSMPKAIKGSFMSSSFEFAHYVHLFGKTG